ncbi:uncharacterized protein LOC130646309 [Hydractinia symbiolongicarpus]|uniref:uncharacterized protein LOC130646309 n=1 Tax=Hydractinia symbiolongicarpus TaxID=13093 RepID=UPI00254DDB0C|nr:uncharacterized protein LOC130646309 [Hydractinia symbiolongicarpus]
MEEKAESQPSYAGATYSQQHQQEQPLLPVQTQQPFTTVVTVQQPFVQPVHVPNYAVLSWLACFFCCWPIGIVAVVKSFQVNNALAVNDIPRAQRASEAAKQYAISAVIFGIACIVGSIVLQLFVLGPK